MIVLFEYTAICFLLDLCICAFLCVYLCFCVYLCANTQRRALEIVDLIVHVHVAPLRRPLLIIFILKHYFLNVHIVVSFNESMNNHTL